MAKVIKNPIEVKIVRDDGEITCSAHYGLSCDEYPELEKRKGLPIAELTPAELVFANQILDWAITKIKAHEQIEG